MHLKRPTSVRTLLVPVLVLLLGMAAIVSIIGLQGQSRDSADAQLELARAENALNLLQVAPFRAARQTGGSPTIARGTMDGEKREIDRVIAGLRRSSHPAAIDQLVKPLRDNYATLQRIATSLARSPETPGDTTAFDDLTTVLMQALGQARRLVAQIRTADRAYEQRAQSAELRAKIGTAAVILLLVAGFGLLYRRSVRARTIAEGLVGENGRLLAASRVEALIDSLTGLPNRRSLRRDLDESFGLQGHLRRHVLALFDLDGFKQYNDTFGHPAGDALLSRLGARLSSAVSGEGTAYRMGGDEFCVLALAGTDNGDALIAAAAEALSEIGEAFDIGCSFGSALIPAEATDAEDALRIADQRMYVHKASHSTPSRQSTDVLLKVLSERSPNLHMHLNNVAELAEAVSRRVGLAEMDVQWIRLAAELHDVGKVAIPDAILSKPGPLSDGEWAFMRRHTIIGERIIRSAPSLAPAAMLVRSSHERYDGKGYPDGLRAEEIEVGASIIAVCDAYDAMVGHRVYRETRTPQEALAELRRCAGSQFEPGIVEIFCETVQRHEQRLALAAEPA